MKYIRIINPFFLCRVFFLLVVYPYRRCFCSSNISTFVECFSAISDVVYRFHIELANAISIFDGKDEKLSVVRLSLVFFSWSIDNVNWFVVEEDFLSLCFFLLSFSSRKTRRSCSIRRQDALDFSIQSSLMSFLIHQFFSIDLSFWTS